MPTKNKKDNGHIAEKLQLRKNHLPDKKSISVLDVCHGYGVMWETIERQKKEYDFSIVGIEIRDLKNNPVLPGDNLKYLPSIDLSGFDIIDIDVYGSPDKQINAIVENGSYQNGVIVFATYIQRGKVGSIGGSILYSIGYTRSMVKKCPSMFMKNPFDKLKMYLYTIGVRDIYFYEEARTFYLCFQLYKKS